MSRYIDADNLKNAKCLIADNPYAEGWNDAIDAIVECEPTADVRPNVHGEWCEYKNPTEQEIVLRLNRWICNKCFMPQRYTSKFCPNCGALMSESLKLAEVGKAIAEGLNEGLNCDAERSEE